MRKLAVMLAVIALVTAFAPATAHARSKWNDPQKKLMAKEGAIADAYRKLAERVKGLQIEAETYVRDFVAESDEIDKSVNAFVRFAELGKPRYYEDGICEVDATLKLSTIVTELEKIRNGVYKGGKFKGTVFQKITQHVETDVIEVTGSAALADDRAEAEGGGRRPLPARGGRNAGFWRGVPAKHKLMAKEAAIADCYRKLAERVKGVRIDAQTTVRDFVTESDEINKAVRTNLRWVKLNRPKWLEDGIVEVRGSVKLNYIITTLDQIVEAKYKGDKVKMKRWQQVKQESHNIVVEATGSGTTSWGDKSDDDDGDTDEGDDMAPGKGMVDDDDPVIPAWARQVYTATGKGALADDEELSEARRKIKAERAALVDARRRLLEHIKGLRVDSRTTVSDFATETDEIRTQIDGLIRGSRQEGKPKWSEDGICEVTVVLDLKDLWRILQAQRRLKGARR